MKKILTVEGMSCGHCTNTVEKSLMDLSEVNSAKADLSSKTVEVEGHNLNDDALRKAVEEAGYEVVDIKVI
ncbi:heavy-metal-associated domain-containing protein [Anaeromonas gelatinilytica]|uniref:heavy-metal-associated domain-containing protein n=1 Tax=Anaeromonas gelatinilytica TaxID=2683194 RepID=UPI001A9CA076